MKTLITDLLLALFLVASQGAYAFECGDVLENVKTINLGIRLDFATQYAKFEDFEVSEFEGVFTTKRKLLKGLGVHVLTYTPDLGYEAFTGTIIENNIKYSDVRGLEDMVVGGFFQVQTERGIVSIPHSKIEQIRGFDLDLRARFVQDYSDYEDFEVSRFEGSIVTKKELSRGLGVHVLTYTPDQGYEIVKGMILTNQIQYSDVEGLEDMVVGGVLELELENKSVIKIPHREIEQMRQDRLKN